MTMTARDEKRRELIESAAVRRMEYTAASTSATDIRIQQTITYTSAHGVRPLHVQYVVQSLA